MKIRDLLVMLYLDIALEGNKTKPTVISGEEWQKICQKVGKHDLLHITIDVLYNVPAEESAPKLWSKLEGLHTTKSLTN